MDIERAEENQSTITKLEAKRYLNTLVAEECKMMSKKIDTELAKIMTIIRSHEKLLADMNKRNQKFIEISENAEVTLSNVLLAIRQNSFLQAWYPAQNGRPEQYVVGKYKE